MSASGPKGRLLTDEQARVVSDREGPLLVAANAGSGKTFALVERFARTVIDDGVAPDRILAVTFTEKAAAELRSRVRDRLIEHGEYELAARLQGAWVCTIHAACLRILRAHAVAAGLDPAFAIADVPMMRSIGAEGWRDAVQRVTSEAGGGTAAIDVLAVYGLDAVFEEIHALHESRRSAGGPVALPARPTIPVPDPGPLARACAAVADELEVASPTKSISKAQAALRRCAALVSAEWGSSGPSAAAIDDLTLPRRGKALQSLACVHYSEVLEAYAAAWRDRYAVGVLDIFDALLRAYSEAVSARKRDAGVLDFADLELRCRDLLAHSPTLRTRYAARFERVLVDEFQDSSPLQVQLFSLLATDDRLVTVGDEFQSIYRFRHADVRVFRERRARLGPDCTAVLSANFRSDPAILAAANAICGPVFGDSFAPLRAGDLTRWRSGHDESGGEPAVELLLTDAPAWAGADHAACGQAALAGLPEAPAGRRAEARLVAQRLADLVAAGESPGEIVVLVRTLSSMPLFERALQDAGLSVVAEGGRGYWARQVVRDLCGWLAALANPRDELALLGVLSSPLVGVSSSGLLAIAQRARGRVWAAIEAGEVFDALGPEDRDRVARFAGRFAHERALAHRVSVDTLLERVIEAASYDLHVLRLVGGERRLANIHKLLRLAANVQGAGADLRGFVDYAMTAMAEQAREGDAPVELAGESAIRLMSVHAAKGLEFGVVVVADLGRELNKQTATVLVDGDRVGVRVRGYGEKSAPGLDYGDLSAAERIERRAEEERIAYVALTRAERRLIISGTVAVDAWPDGTTPSATSISWIAPALVGPVAGGALSAAQPIVDAPVGHERDGYLVRCMLNTPATVSTVLRAVTPSEAGLAHAQPVGVAGPGPTPAVASAAPDRLSFSQLADHARCGYSYYLRRIVGLPVERETSAAGRLGREDPAASGLDGRVRGSIVHQLLEHFDPRSPGVWTADADAATRHAVVRETAQAWGQSLSVGEVDELASLVVGFAGSALARQLAASRWAAPEYPFAVLLPTANVLLSGVVDVVATERDGSMLVVDYKTNEVSEGVDRLAYLQERYGLQRDAYAFAALASGAPEVTVAYVLLDRPDEPVLTVVTADELPMLGARLEDAASDLLAGRYSVTARPHHGLCATCPGRRGLCSHPREAQTASV